MQGSIGRKILIKSIWALSLVILLVSASQIVVSIFKSTSEELVIEYHEMNSLQELNLSLTQLLISINEYIIEPESFDTTAYNNQVNTVLNKLNTCKLVITETHNPEKLDHFEIVILDIIKTSDTIFILTSPHDATAILPLLDKVKLEIHELIEEGESLVSETRAEISEYEVTYNTVVRHGRSTTITLGILILLIMIFLGWSIIRNITKPIRNLVSATTKISKGDTRARVKIDSNDEFQLLANSFNEMLDSLNQTSVSKNYLDNILRNMFNALVVTDNQLLIRSVNNAFLKMTGFSENDIIGVELHSLFSDPISTHIPDSPNGKKWTLIKNNIADKKELLSKQKVKIPVLVTSSLLESSNKDVEGLIIVVNDMRQQKKMENEIKQIRNEHLIEINEAQEEEKIRIAKDLHDGLGQMLTAVSYSISEMDSLIPDKNVDYKDIISKTQTQVDAAIKETKNLAYNLIPIVLKDFGLIPAVNNMIERANETFDIQFSFNAINFHNRIDPRLEKALYRICQEALNNIVKHSQAKKAIFQIYRQYQVVVLVIEDDGIGFKKGKDIDLHGSGIGLISMRERVGAFNGAFTINSGEGEGTEIIIELPCRKS